MEFKLKNWRKFFQFSFFLNWFFFNQFNNLYRKNCDLVYLCVCVHFFYHASISEKKIFANQLKFHALNNNKSQEFIEYWFDLQQQIERGRKRKPLTFWFSSNIIIIIIFSGFHDDELIWSESKRQQQQQKVFFFFGQ